jgi:ribonuclease J
VRERRKLSAVGIVVVALALTRKGEIVAEPQVIIDGVPAETAAGDPMIEVVLTTVNGTLRSIPTARRKEAEMVREAVRRSVRGAVNEAWGKKPIVKVMINVVEDKR